VSQIPERAIFLDISAISKKKFRVPTERGQNHTEFPSSCTVKILLLKSHQFCVLYRTQVFVRNFIYRVNYMQSTQNVCSFSTKTIYCANMYIYTTYIMQQCTILFLTQFEIWNNRSNNLETTNKILCFSFLLAIWFVATFSFSCFMIHILKPSEVK
jgi:hypothetical protein